MKISVHDNHLVSYEVDSKSNQITLHTEYDYGHVEIDRTDVIFTGVIDHYFRYPLLPSIIFDVEEIEIHAILIRDNKLMKEGQRMSGWPSFWRDSIDEMYEDLTGRGIKMFEISSSYGMDGWVAASSCEFRPVEGENLG